MPSRVNAKIISEKIENSQASFNGELPKEEAKYVWERVVDHKWYVGEQLQRDIGFRAAAVDYVENFYDATMFRKNDDRKGFFNRMMRTISQLTRDYFVAKSKTLSSL